MLLTECSSCYCHYPANIHAGAVGSNAGDTDHRLPYKYTCAQSSSFFFFQIFTRYFAWYLKSNLNSMTPSLQAAHCAVFSAVPFWYSSNTTRWAPVGFDNAKRWHAPQWCSEKLALRSAKTWRLLRLKLDKNPLYATLGCISATSASREELSSDTLLGSSNTNSHRERLFEKYLWIKHNTF